MVDIDPNFPAENSKRKIIRKKVFDYESQNEYVPTPKENFKVNFFFSVLDATINAIQDHFEQLKFYVNKFHLIQSFNNICKMSKDEILKHSKHLENAQSDPTSEEFSKRYRYRSC